MNRFPLFSMYRFGFLSISTFLVLSGFLVGLLSSGALAWFDGESTVITRLTTFVYAYLISVTLAFLLLTVSELLKVFLSMEDHLYHIRYADAASASSSASGKSVNGGSLASTISEEPDNLQLAHSE
jgi:hypothetical protein